MVYTDSDTVSQSLAAELVWGEFLLSDEIIYAV